jgi:integrase
MGKQWRKYQVGPYRLGTLYKKTLGRYEAVVTWVDKDGEHRRRLGVFTEAEGRNALDAFVGSVQALKGREGLMVAEVWDAYKKNRETDGKLMEAFVYNWRALAPRFAGMRVADITDDVCRDYAKKRLAAGRIICKRNRETGQIEDRRVEISVGTVWSELLRLRSCLNWAEDRRVIPWAPYIWIPCKPHPRDTVMTEADVLLLIDNCVVPHVRLFVILAITTAGRSASILQLTWDRIDFEAGTIDLNLREVIDPLTKRARKGRSKVKMTEEARAALLQAKAGARTNHVIEWEDMPVKCIRKGFQGAVRRAGLSRKATPHILRHTVLTWLEEDGVPIERISRLAGHRDVNTTRRIYLKPGVDTLQPAADVIDLRLRRERKVQDENRKAQI